MKSAARDNDNSRAVLHLGGVAGWLMQRLRSGAKIEPRLTLLERITLGPRQTLALVEADGRRILVATSPEGATAFHALDELRVVGEQSRARARIGAGIGAHAGPEQVKRLRARVQ